MRKKTLTREDLFCEPNFDELREIALDPATGAQRRLNQGQLESILSEGEFEVDSREFPNQKHKWALSQFLIKGKNKSHETLLRDLARALHLLIITGGDRIAGSNFSICSSINRLSYGIMQILDMLIGLPLTHNPQLDLQIHNERSRYLVAELQSLDKNVINEFCAFIVQRLESGAPLQDLHLLPQAPFRFRTSQGLEVDLALFNGHLMSQVKPIVHNVLVKALKEDGWVAQMQREIVSELMAKSTPEAVIQATTEALLASEYKHRVCKMILADPGLNSLLPELPQLLVDQLKTSLIIQDALKEEARRLEEYKKQVEADLVVRHPLLSRIRPWMKRRLATAHDTFMEKNLWSAHTAAIETCQTEGLYQSGYFLQRDLTFRRDRETMLKKELEQMVVPVKEFTFETRIWRPSNWVVTRRKRSRTGRLSDKTEVIPTVICQDGDEETQLPSRGGGAAGNNHVAADTEFVYEVQKTTLTKTCSNFGWRWRTFFHRTNSAMWNLIYWLGIVIPFVSKVSFKAVFHPRPYFPDYQIDQWTGKLKTSTYHKVLTVNSRLRDLWAHVRENRAAFEQTSDVGLLSKSALRYWNIFVNYVLKGAAGTLFYVLVLPPVYLLISTVSLALAVAAPLYVWPGSALLHLLAFVFFDFEGAQMPQMGFTNAIMWNVVFNVVIAGMCQPVLAALVAFVLCPVSALVITGGSFIRKGLRDTWDSLVFHAVLKNRARVPVKDGFLAKRIAGPGLAGSHFYQIKTEQALIALETKMELDQIQAFERETKERIWTPYNDYRNFVDNVLKPFKVQPQHNELKNESEALQSRLGEVVERRKIALKQRLPKDWVQSRIRLNEADLRIVLQEGARLTKEFYPSNVLARMNSEGQQSFWFDRNLVKGDFVGLASSLLAGTFSQDFLTPLQEMDLSFHLKVKHWNLERYLTMALESKWSGDLDQVDKIIQSPKCKVLIAQPEINISSVNPMNYDVPSRFSNSYKSTWFNSERWAVIPLARRSGESSSSFCHYSQLSDPVTVPHPYEICVLIYNRDNNATNLESPFDVDSEKLKSLLRRLRDLKSREREDMTMTIIPFPEDNDDDEGDLSSQGTGISTSAAVANGCLRVVANPTGAAASAGQRVSVRRGNPSTTSSVSTPPSSSTSSSASSSPTLSPLQPTNKPTVIATVENENVIRRPGRENSSNGNNNSAAAQQHREIDQAMATLTKSLDELDENARLMSEQQHQQPPRRQTSDGPASFSTNAATLRSKASPKRYIDYSYQQNFGMGLGSTAREPGSIPLLLSTGKQQDCSSSSGNSSDEAAGGSNGSPPSSGGRFAPRKFDELPRGGAAAAAVASSRYAGASWSSKIAKASSGSLSSTVAVGTATVAAANGTSENPDSYSTVV